MSEMVRLVWKEYRALRGLWLALAIFGLACDALFFFFTNSLQERVPGFFGLAGVLPAGFALGAGAMLFALEREEASYEFLRCLPLTSPRVFAGKVFTAFMGSLSLGLLLFAVALGDVREMAGWPNIDHGVLPGTLGYLLIYALLVVQGLGWSVFFSLQSARPLLAALLGAIGASSCIGFVHFVTVNLGFAKLDGAWDSPTLHLLATLAVWSADIWLGRRWLHGRRRAERLRRTDTDALKTFKRLMWQEWRSSYRLLIAILVSGVVVPAVLLPLFMPTTVLGFALLGSCTFLADQEARQFRFFAEHGASAKRLWLGRQLFWGGAALALAAILLLAKLLFAHFALGAAPSDVKHLWRTMNWVFEPLNYFIWVLVAFAAGQACSMFFQSGILAAALGVVLAGIFGGWMSAMQALDVGLWWSAGPLAVALFAATWLRSAGWLLERHTWRSWSPALLAPTITSVVLLLSVPAYRVWEIPEPITSVELTPPPQPSADAARAARRFERLRESLSGLAFTGLSPNYDALSPLRLSSNSAPVAAELEWLKHNEDTLKQAISAIDELPPDATIASGTPSESPHLGFDALGAMILRYGQLAENDGQLDEAWRRYQSVIKLAAFVRRENGVVGEVLGNNLVPAAAMQLIRWGGREGQTAARLQAAINALRGSEADEPPLAKVVLDDYRDYVAIVDRIAARSSQATPQEALIAKWAPWEIARLRRLYRYTASLNLLEARIADAELAGLSGLAKRGERQGYSATVPGLWETTIIGPMIEANVLVRSRCFAICHRRAAELALGVQAWRLERGALPAALSQLEGVYFDALPVDPHTGRSFAWFPCGVSERVRLPGGDEIAAGTPFLYSIGMDGNWVLEEQSLEDLRRGSADKPTTQGKPVENLRGLVFPIPSP